MSATIKDVARVSGISVATVSKYLNRIPVRPHSAEKIEAAIRELGYIPNPVARSLRVSRTMNVGVLVDNITNNFYSTLISRLCELMQQNNYSCLLHEIRRGDHDQVLEAASFLASKKVDGLFIIASHLDKELLAPLQEMFKNLVIIDCYIGDFNADFILTDNLSAAYHATEMFLVNGHRKIALITGRDDSFSAKERKNGYLRALQDYNIPIREEYIFQEDFNMDGGHRAFLRLADIPEDERPTAVLIASYFLTLGSLMALNERHMNVPDDISLICFDNYDINRVFVPALTCVQQPADEICEKAAAKMLERIEASEQKPSITRLGATMIAGDSVKTL